MAQEQVVAVQPTRRLPRLSLDWWAVISALVLAALILVGIIPSIPW
jgi:hypothetical protein